MANRSNASGPKLLAALFAAFAAFPLAVAFYAAAAGLAAAGWSETSGVILESNWQVQTGNNNWKTPVVRYRYRVGEIEHEGDRLQFGPVVSVEARVNALPEGSTQRVYYDPDDPSRSSLHVGVAWSTFALYLAAGLFSLAIAAYLWRR